MIDFFSNIFNLVANPLKSINKMYKNLIALIPVDEQYTEIEFTSYKHILDVLKTIENRGFNKATGRYRLPIDSVRTFIDQIKDYTDVSCLLSTTEDQPSSDTVNVTEKNDTQSTEKPKEPPYKKQRSHDDQRNVTCTVSVQCGSIQAKFSRYWADAINVIKRIGGSRFDPTTKAWSLNNEKYLHVLGELKQIGVIVNNTVRLV